MSTLGTGVLRKREERPLNQPTNSQHTGYVSQLLVIEVLVYWESMLYK